MSRRRRQMPAGLISCDGSICQIRFGCNIHQLSQLVNVLLAVRRILPESEVCLPKDSQPSPSRPSQKRGRIELNDASGTFHRILVKFNLIGDGRDRNLTLEYL